MVARSGYGTPDGLEPGHPLASAIDTDFPASLERTHMMLKSKAQWIEVHSAPENQEFDTYPQESLAE
ncbi:hypothetical protein NOC27_1563 [Nitrosococcus oceani AFC27]|nr:hypothetical protein NOC27_1563 [Nitrosococcus oceani AFC27]GEM18776.1 hypothetical protein NONS58_01370 [Nitrosococcus oceani]